MSNGCNIGDFDFCPRPLLPINRTTRFRTILERGASSSPFDLLLTCYSLISISQKCIEIRTVDRVHFVGRGFCIELLIASAFGDLTTPTLCTHPARYLVCLFAYVSCVHRLLVHFTRSLLSFTMLSRCLLVRSSVSFLSVVVVV